MLDRYLFRGKDYYNGLWRMGQYVISADLDDCVCDHQLKYNRLNKIKLETLGQCTGLRDKNGKLIFEGDVVRYENQNGDPVGAIDAVVEWNRASWAACGDGAMMPLDCDVLGGFEVIGNIHDNKELMEK